MWTGVDFPNMAVAWTLILHGHGNRVHLKKRRVFHERFLELSHKFTVTVIHEPNHRRPGIFHTGFYRHLLLISDVLRVAAYRGGGTPHLYHRRTRHHGTLSGCSGFPT